MADAAYQYLFIFINQESYVDTQMFFLNDEKSAIDDVQDMENAIGSNVKVLAIMKSVTPAPSNLGYRMLWQRKEPVQGIPTALQ